MTTDRALPSDSLDILSNIGKKSLVFPIGKIKRSFMSSSKTSGFLPLIISLLVWPGPSSLLGAQQSIDTKPKLYDTAADGKQQIADALKIAKTEGKRIILKFGANW